jgi:hypothetical protein
MIEILVSFTASTGACASHVVIDERGLIGFPAMACNLINTNECKSSDDFIRALGITQQGL